MTTLTEDSTSIPTQESLFATSEEDDLSSHRYRQLIGYLGMTLPLLLWNIAGWRPTEGLPRWGLLNSVSAYYYTGSVAVFVGILVALALFLVTYRGYNNEHNRRDRIAGIIAGVAAIGVAFFPTRAPLDSLKPSWWAPHMRAIHYISAIVMFGAFIFFSIYLFPKSKTKEGEPVHLGKRVRNFFYISCGLVMLVCMLWAGSAYFTKAPIFWPETIALVFFAMSWLVKGRADWTLVIVGKRVRHYGRHPGQLISLVRRIIHN